MKLVTALAKQQRTTVTRLFATRTAAIKVALANTADIIRVLDIPQPTRNRVPRFDLDLHIDHIGALSSSGSGKAFKRSNLFPNALD